MSVLLLRCLHTVNRPRIHNVLVLNSEELRSLSLTIHEHTHTYTHTHTYIHTYIHTHTNKEKPKHKQKLTSCVKIVPRRRGLPAKFRPRSIAQSTQNYPDHRPYNLPKIRHTIIFHDLGLSINCTGGNAAVDEIRMAIGIFS